MLENKYHKSKKIYSNICSKTWKFEIAYKLPESASTIQYTFENEQ